MAYIVILIAIVLIGTIIYYFRRYLKQGQPKAKASPESKPIKVPEGFYEEIIESELALEESVEAPAVSPDPNNGNGHTKLEIPGVEFAQLSVEQVKIEKLENTLSDMSEAIRGMTDTLNEMKAKKPTSNVNREEFNKRMKEGREKARLAKEQAKTTEVQS